MAVYGFRARNVSREDATVSGTVIADNEQDARHKINRRYRDFNSIRLRKFGGLTGLLKALRADIR